MKIAISGKGGVGKTLLAAHLTRAFSASGYAVIAIDADPDANLAATLGFPDSAKIVPLAKMKGLIAERTGTQPGEAASIFKLNPRVDDIPKRYSAKHDGIRLLVMGQLKKGGSGCYCAENSLLAALLTHLLIARDEVVILDMSAGIEHLSRGTARSVDRLLIVVEPGRASVETAHKINKLARDIGIESMAVVGNKIQSQQEERYIRAELKGFEILGFIPYDRALVAAELSNLPALEASQKITAAVKRIYQRLVSTAKEKTAAVGH